MRVCVCVCVVIDLPFLDVSSIDGALSLFLSATGGGAPVSADVAERPKPAVNTAAGSTIDC